MNCPNCGRPLTLDVKWQYIDEIAPSMCTPDVFDISQSMNDVADYIGFEHIVNYHMFCKAQGCPSPYFKVTDFEEITDVNGDKTVLIKEIKPV